MPGSQQSEVGRGLSFAPAIEGVESRGNVRCRVEVNPFVRAGCALQSPQHARAESKPRAAA
jgi:hypothetical protein